MATGDFVRRQPTLRVERQHSMGAADDGLQSLMSALIYDAARVYQKHFAARDPARRRAFSEARKWLEGGRGPITFEAACAAVGIDPQWFRESLAARTAAGQRISLRLETRRAVMVSPKRAQAASLREARHSMRQKTN